jgi:hypothetical protein
MEKLRTHWTFSIAGAVVVAPAIIRIVPVFKSASAQRWILRAALVAAGFAAPILALACFYLLRAMGELSMDPDASSWSALHYCSGRTLLALVAFSSGVFATLLLNVNLTGPHKFCRDQLARTFVETDANQITLSSGNASCGAPYHLLNATLNPPSSVSPVLRDRRGDFFVFAKRWSGAPSIGYHETSQWRSNGGEIDLATAMAISGAAVSPQMGLGSMPTLSALLTLLNVRLGFWIARPGRFTIGPPGFLCLLREMTGRRHVGKERVAQSLGRWTHREHGRLRTASAALQVHNMRGRRSRSRIDFSRRDDARSPRPDRLRREDRAASGRDPSRSQLQVQ